MRPSKVENYMDIAEVVAKRSHDSETKVGAVLVHNKSGAIIATGFNGFVRGANDEILPTTRPAKYEYIQHAEMNLIANCARHSVGTDDCTLICTLSPCKSCMRMLFACGVTHIISKSLYSDFDEILQMKDISVAVSLNEQGFYTIEYTTKIS